MLRYVVGVDGGATKTVALVSDTQGRIRGAARGRGSNWVGTKVDSPMEIVASTVREALVQAGITPNEVDVAVCCLAGADWPEDHVARRQALQRMGIAKRVIVKNDAFAGLRAGTRQRWGVVITAGTATNTAAIAPDGREWAFGYYVDCGGAGDIARATIRAVLRAEDGRGEPTLLSRRVLTHFGLRDGEGLLRAIQARQLAAGPVHGLCPLVFDVANTGDPVACRIIREHGECLAEYAAAIIRRFDMANLAFDVVLSGSLFKGVGPLLVETMTEAIHAVSPRSRVVRSRLEPALGSVLLALDALDVAFGEEEYSTLERSTPDESFFSTVDGGTLDWEIVKEEMR